MNSPARIFFTLCWISAIVFTVVFFIAIKQVPSGDETISYLCATGNQEAYERVLREKDIYGREVNAQEIKRFLANHENSLGSIAPDLAQTDLHPPLYFWLLHLFTLLPVQLFTSGLLLNGLLHLGGLFLLLHLCRKLQGSVPVLVFAATAWCLSPAVTGVGFYARQYELLGFINLLAATIFVSRGKTVTAGTFLLLLACITLGMLTHYLFIYFSFAYAGYALLVLRDRSLTWKLLAVNVLAAGLLCLIHPGIFNQFALQQARAQDFETAGLAARTGKVILAFVQVILPVLSLKSFFMALPRGLTLAVSVSVIGGAFLLLWKSRQQLILHNMGSTARFLLWMFGCSSGLLIIPYLLFLTPYHSMGGQYLALVYPFLLIGAGVMLSHSKKLFVTVLSAMCVGGVLQLWIFYSQQRSDSRLIGQVKSSGRIVVNTVNRRAFLRLVPYLDGQQVLLDKQAGPCTYAGQPVLFISEKKPDVECARQNEFDLRDGVTFYTAFTDSCSCASFRSK